MDTLASVVLFIIDIMFYAAGFNEYDIDMTEKQYNISIEIMDMYIIQSRRRKCNSIILNFQKKQKKSKCLRISH